MGLPFIGAEGAILLGYPGIRSYRRGRRCARSGWSSGCSRKAGHDHTRRELHAPCPDQRPLADHRDALALDGRSWSTLHLTAQAPAPPRPRPRTEPDASRCGRDIPTQRGSSSAMAVRVAYEVYGRGEPTILFVPTWSIVHSPDLEGADPLPRSTPSRRHVRSPRQRPLGPAVDPRTPIRSEQMAADLLAVHGRDRDRPRGPRIAVARRAAGPDPRGGASGPRRRPGLHRPGSPSRRGPDRPAATSRSTSRSTPMTAGRGTTRHFWRRDYGAFLEFFFVAVLHGAALDQADRGRDRLGPRDGPGDPRPDRGRAPGLGDRRDSGPVCPRSRVRRWSSRATRTRDRS